MKQFFYTIIFIFFTASLFGQAATQDGTIGGGKPVIEDIGARSFVNTNPVDNMVQVGLNTTGPSVVAVVNNTKGKDQLDQAKSGDEVTTLAVKKNLKFYPNPAYNDLNIDLGQTVNVEVRLINVIGQEVYFNKGEFQRMSIDVSNMPQGSYFLSIKIGKENIVKRIEVSK